MLSKYAKEHGFGNTRYYVDDGYTGTNFNRPGFQKLLEDMKEDKKGGKEDVSNSIQNQVVICKGWFLHPNTYDCGSFVVN